MEVSFAGCLEDHSSPFQQIIQNMTTNGKSLLLKNVDKFILDRNENKRYYLDSNFDVHVFSKAAAVVVPSCSRVAERLIETTD